jgi:hypothetical protein
MKSKRIGKLFFNYILDCPDILLDPTGRTYGGIKTGTHLEVDFYSNGRFEPTVLCCNDYGEYYFEGFYGVPTPDGTWVRI